MAIGTDEKAMPWYKAEIGPRLKPRTRKRLETYSKIPPGDVVGHLHAIVRTFHFQRAGYLPS